MNKRQKITAFAPIALLGSMYFVYRQLANTYGGQFTWYAGFWIYWLGWGAIFPFAVMGKDEILRLISPQRPNAKIVIFILFPLVMTIIFRVLTGSHYAKTDILWTILLVSTAFGNGFFEEVLWRATFVIVFPNNIFYRMIWPSFCFALWHYIPGSLSPNSNVAGLMIGSGLFGLYLAFLARRTGTIWWCIVCHTLGGIIMVV